MMLVADADSGEPAVGPAATARLAQMGVSHIVLLRDMRSTALVLDGWAFNPTRVDDVVQAVFPEDRAAVRAFQEIEHVVISATEQGRGTE